MTDHRPATMHRSARDLAIGYFDAWRRKDLDAYAGLLADEVTFRGPLGETDGADATRAAFKGLAGITRAVDVERVFVDGDDVATWFQLHVTPTDTPLQVVNWMHTRDGLIDRIRVTFDPRPLFADAD